MSDIAKHGPTATGFALVMESDIDLRGVICDALVLDGHRVECVADCAAVLARRPSGATLPDEFVLALGAGENDPDWDTLRGALYRGAGPSRGDNRAVDDPQRADFSCARQDRAEA